MCNLGTEHCTQQREDGEQRAHGGDFTEEVFRWKTDTQRQMLSPDVTVATLEAGGTYEQSH